MLKCHFEEKAHNLITKWNKPQGLQETEEEQEEVETKKEKYKSESLLLVSEKWHQNQGNGL
jgi:hypothetical protein